MPLSPAVFSVAARTGAVVLTKSDVGLNLVDNTSDASKPVSTLTQTALNLKLNAASPSYTGTLAGTGKVALTGTSTATAAIEFGSAGDVNIYRYGADCLATDDIFRVWAASTSTIAVEAKVVAEGTSRWGVLGDGKTSWGPGTAAQDTNLYRNGIGILKTDGALVVGTDLTVGDDITVTGAVTSSTYFMGIVAGGTFAIFHGRVGAETVSRSTITADGKISWGDGTAAVDTNLYRNGANILKTDDTLAVGLGLTVGTTIAATGSVSGTYFQAYAATGGAMAFRSQVGSETFDRLSIVGTGQMYWGDGIVAVDTNLYRSAANTLKTDDSFIVVGTLSVSPASGNALINIESVANPILNWKVSGTAVWIDKVVSGIRYMADTNRNHLWLTSGASATAAITTLSSSLVVQGNLGFYSGTAVAKPTGVAVTAAGIHAALVTLNLIAA